MTTPKTIQTDFFTKLKEIERQNKELFENVDLQTMSSDEAKVRSCKLYKDFILSFHYPHEKDSPYLKNELKTDTQPFNGESK